MLTKSIKDYFNVVQLENHGPVHADDNPDKLKQTISCTCGAVSTGILYENYSQRTDVILFSMTNVRDILNSLK